ncbi:MAG: DMT family transporter [Chitinophagaceae bacterium]
MKKAYYQLHLAVLLAGFTGILGRLITLDEVMIVFYRLLITAITMWLLFSGRKTILRISQSLQLKIIGVGVIAAAHWVTFYGAIKFSNVSIALVCFSTLSFFTALMEPLILKKAINYVELLLGVITLVGVYIIFQFDAQYKLGIIVGIISAFLAALFPILNRELLKETNVDTLLTWQQTGGFLFLAALLPFHYWLGETPRLMPIITDLGWLLVLSWFCSVWAFQLSGHALKKLSAFTVNLSFNLEPVYGILLAFLIYREDQLLSKWFFVGFGLIALALLTHIWLLIRRERLLTRLNREPVQEF